MNLTTGDKLIRAQNQKRMVMVLCLTVFFMFIELITALLTKSLALLADAGHMMTDVGAIVFGLIAFWFANKPATPGKTYGYYRSEILAGLINALLLVGISFFIIYAAWLRLHAPEQIAPIPVIAVALFGLLINLACLKLLDDGENKEKKSINLKAASLEIYADALVSMGVVISGLIIFFTHWYEVDALISLAIGLLILPRIWGVLKECINILMEGTPQHIDLEAMRNSMLSVSGVIDVHDIHVWTITSGLDSMSAHILVDKQTNLDQVLETVTKVLQEKFNLNHTTIQIEQTVCQVETNICS